MTDLRTALETYIMGSDHPDLVVYRKDFGTKFDFDRWHRVVKRTCEVSGFRNKRVLEVGCGFGWDAFGLALVGGNSVLATDILPSMIDGANECLAAARAKGISVDIEARAGDICSLDEPDGTFDGIYSSEAIEHVHDLDAMFRRCHALLKNGGTAYITNDSNVFNSSFRNAMLAMWEERDGSWEHADWLKREIRPIEHANAKPYAAMREEIIRETGIPFSDAEMESLIHATAGMIRPGIVEAAGKFKATGALPTRPDFAWCRNPETGEYAERLLDPFELKQMLKNAGFRSVKMRHGFNRFPIHLVNGVAFRPLNKLLFERQPTFVLLAEK